MKLKLTLIIIIGILIAAVFLSRSAVAADVPSDADVIVLDDSCRLIRKPAAKTLKKKTIRVDFNRPKAKPPAPAASAASAPIVKPKPKAKAKPRVTVLPEREIPAEYELNCDEGGPPPFSLFPPPADFTPAPPYSTEPEPLPFNSPFPPLYVVPTLPPDNEVTPEPRTFVGIVPPPTYIFIGPPALAPPSPVPALSSPIPEPATLPLLVLGLAAIVIYRSGRRT